MVGVHENPLHRDAALPGLVVENVAMRVAAQSRSAGRAPTSLATDCAAAVARSTWSSVANAVSPIGRPSYG